MDNTNAVLAPCSFCGGPAHRIEPMGDWVPNGPPHYGPNKVRYVCAALYEDPVRHCPVRQVFAQDDEPEAIAAWNTRQPTQNDALREALEAAPLIGRTESVYDFMERQNAWLNGPYRVALERSK